ncbi:MAG TPA: UPF0149 family protein [Pseudoxanthomonas sp.]
MTAPHADGPMSEDEMDQLAEFLAEHIVPHGGMSLEILDGFFSALVVGPELVMPSEYLPEIRGESPEWEDPEQEQQALTLVVRLWNHIVWRVRQPIVEDLDADEQSLLVPPFGLPELPEGATQDEEADDYDPLADVPDDFPFAAGWANGFLHGMSLRQMQWDSWLEQDEGFLGDIALLLELSVISPEHRQEMGLPAGEALGLEERLDAAMAMPGMLQEMYLQHLEDTRPQPIRRAPEPGRNDPCPCGSGKKYKKCCGEGARLH